MKSKRTKETKKGIRKKKTNKKKNKASKTNKKNRIWFFLSFRVTSTLLRVKHVKQQWDFPIMMPMLLFHKSSEDQRVLLVIGSCLNGGTRGDASSGEMRRGKKPHIPGSSVLAFLVARSSAIWVFWMVLMKRWCQHVWYFDHLEGLVVFTCWEGEGM